MSLSIIYNTHYSPILLINIIIIQQQFKKNTDIYVRKVIEPMVESKLIFRTLLEKSTSGGIFILNGGLLQQKMD